MRAVVELAMLRDECVKAANRRKGASILSLIVRDGLRLAIAGLVLGVVFAMATASNLQRLLYETSAFDPMTVLRD